MNKNKYRFFFIILVLFKFIQTILKVYLVNLLKNSIFYINLDKFAL
jgi:hypothetical protein